MNQIVLQSTVKKIVTLKDNAKPVQFYEEAIQADPDIVENYWCLGLVYLLRSQEEAAALTWFGGVSGQADEKAAILSLVQVLEWAAEGLKLHHQIQQAWAVRRHIREFAPQQLSNLLELCNLSFELEELDR